MIEDIKYSKWECYLSGTNTDGICFCPVEGNHPNWFHRLMQRLILGFKWEKRDG